jgi:hypothetical protein
VADIDRAGSFHRHLVLGAKLDAMDSRHGRTACRITLAAVLFAVSATFFFVMAWHRLEAVGFFEAICPGRKSWDIGTIGHVFVLMTLFYILGHAIFNRRYK